VIGDNLKPGFIASIGILCHRSLLDYIKNPLAFTGRWINYFIMAIVLGTMCKRQPAAPVG
jgi:hypothetical protein